MSLLDFQFAVLYANRVDKTTWGADTSCGGGSVDGTIFYTIGGETSCKVSKLDQIFQV